MPDRSRRPPTQNGTDLPSPSALGSDTPSVLLSARSQTPSLGAPLARSRRNSPLAVLRGPLASPSSWAEPQSCCGLASSIVAFHVAYDILALDLHQIVVRSTSLSRAGAQTPS